MPALDEARQLLQRFGVIRLDAQDGSTPVIGPDGKATTPAQWLDREGFSRLSALSYVNETGQSVLESDAAVERQTR